MSSARMAGRADGMRRMIVTRRENPNPQWAGSRRQPPLAQQDLGSLHWEADDVGVRAGNAGDEGVVVLNAVATGFALPGVGGDVGAGLQRRKLAHADCG